MKNTCDIKSPQPANIDAVVVLVNNGYLSNRNEYFVINFDGKLPI